MTHAFAGLVYPFFDRVIDLLHRIEAGEDPSVGGEKQVLVALLAEAEANAGASGTLAQDFRAAMPALIYWADEVLIDSPWRRAKEWEDHIIEFDYFDERERADRFFEAAHRAETLAGTDPIETYYLCVAMGFRGKFADDPAGLSAWAGRVIPRVRAGLNQRDRFLPDAPAEGGPLEPLPGPSTLLAVSLLVAVSALVTVACFVVAIPPWD